MVEDFAFILNPTDQSQRLAHPIFRGLMRYIPLAPMGFAKAHGMYVDIPAGSAAMIPFLAFSTNARKLPWCVRITEQEFEERLVCKPFTHIPTDEVIPEGNPPIESIDPTAPITDVAPEEPVEPVAPITKSAPSQRGRPKRK